ncbi:MAG: carboxypeptidase-like regulatory domain-containing protein [Myxococcota bacterium]
MLLLASTLLSQAHAGLFSPADEDRDGVPDRRDRCIAMAETVNGYADHDGCPDHLAALDVVPWIGDTAVRATVTVLRESGETVSNGLRVAEDLVPNEVITVRAEALCYTAEAQLTVAPGRNHLELPLVPRYGKTVQWSVTDITGQPVESAQVRFDSPCAPYTPIALTDGQGSVRVGAGEHSVRIEAPGFEPVEHQVRGNAGVVEVTLVPIIDELDAVADASGHSGQ